MTSFISTPVRIFCGADRSQHLPFRVLEHSIRRHSSLPVDIRIIDNSLAPSTNDPRHAPYTEFSFGRFAIPQLCSHAGRAIYLDSDMLVFRDIAELWNLSFESAKILIEIPESPAHDTSKQAAVMLLDCASLNWNVTDIIAGLGRDYTYNELMSLQPLLAPGEIAQRVPNGWNDLDQYDTNRTRLLHYTEIRTQPWVYTNHPQGTLWFAELRRMLDNGSLTSAELREEVQLGYLRPSALIELGIESHATTNNQTAFAAYDRACGFVAHQHLLARFAERRRAIGAATRDQKIRQRPWLKPLYQLAYKLRYR